VVADRRCGAGRGQGRRGGVSERSGARHRPRQRAGSGHASVPRLLPQRAGSRGRREPSRSRLSGRVAARGVHAIHLIQMPNPDPSPAGRPRRPRPAHRVAVRTSTPCASGSTCRHSPHLSAPTQGSVLPGPGRQRAGIHRGEGLTSARSGPVTAAVSTRGCSSRRGWADGGLRIPPPLELPAMQARLLFHRFAVLLPGALAVVARFRTQPFDLRPALGTRLLDVVPQLVGVGGSNGGATAVIPWVLPARRRPARPPSQATTPGGGRGARRGWMASSHGKEASGNRSGRRAGPSRCSPSAVPMRSS